ncbi:helix-turn-helix transcriptional regulator [Actinokineospora auranticolor]|uniref:Helix-turn-helix protein n=1 Tax=Actinokineospora auranticolor TaxID=155976 RepID=A0A2S6GS09_9PSEU|nr:helix-turn-helix transcriptional regulator [Actinokineospora auranticolor]PPK67911.1 helix-turn-helix protein [Actinokineospora auranticolor]
MPSTQTRRKRRFGQYIQGLRERKGVTAEYVAERLRKRASQISKVENGYYLCAYAELTTMLGLYDAKEEEIAEAVSLWDDAKLDPVRIEHSSAVPTRFRVFLRTEADATSVRELQHACVPGLLQTEAYARALEQSSPWLTTPDWQASGFVSAKMARQKLLDGPRALDMRAVVDVGVIRRVVGGVEVMTEQLRRLLELGQRDNIHLQVIDYDAGAYGCMSGPLIIFGFDGSDQDSVYLEYPGGGQWVEDATDTGKFAAIFEAASTRALSAVESAALIRAQVDLLEAR